MYCREGAHALIVLVVDEDEEHDGLVAAVTWEDEGDSWWRCWRPTRIHIISISRSTTHHSDPLCSVITRSAACIWLPRDRRRSWSSYTRTWATIAHLCKWKDFAQEVCYCDQEELCIEDNADAAIVGENGDDDDDNVNVLLLLGLVPFVFLLRVVAHNICSLGSKYILDCVITTRSSVAVTIIVITATTTIFGFLWVSSVY